MVMFHLIPYSAAFERGAIQQEILSELADDVDAIGDVDFVKAEALVLARLPVVDYSSPL